MELISVIVPVYNVEKYLSKCVESILGQSYQNLEILLIDDGSTDGSGKICDEYAARDSRIKVFHQQNNGPAEARNIGLQKVTGKYIALIDSDDYIKKDFITELYSHLVNTGADVVQGNYVIVDENGNALEGRQPKAIDEICTGYECLSNLYKDGYVPGNIIFWNKLYKKELWDRIVLPTGNRHDDEYALVHIYDRAAKVTIFSKVIYYYVMRGGSITNIDNTEYIIGKQFDFLEICNDRIDLFKKRNYTELLPQTIVVKTIFIKRIIKAMKRLSLNKEAKQQLYKKIKADMRHYLVDYIKCKELSRSTKFKLIRYSFGIF